MNMVVFLWFLPLFLGLLIVYYLLSREKLRAGPILAVFLSIFFIYIVVFKFFLNFPIFLTIYIIPIIFYFIFRKVGDEKLAISTSMLVFIILLISIFWIFPLIISEPPRGIGGIADYVDVLILPDAKDKSEATMKMKLKIKGDMKRAKFIIGSAGKELTSGEIMALNIAKGEFCPPPIYLGDLRKEEEYEFDFRLKISNEYEWTDFDLHEVYIVGRCDRPVFFGFYKARYTGFVRGVIKLVTNPEIFNNVSELRMKR